MNARRLAYSMMPGTRRDLGSNAHASLTLAHARI
jgi:hypothetical protein